MFHRFDTFRVLTYNSRQYHYFTHTERERMEEMDKDDLVVGKRYRIARGRFVRLYQVGGWSNQIFWSGYLNNNDLGGSPLLGSPLTCIQIGGELRDSREENRTIAILAIFEDRNGTKYAPSINEDLKKFEPATS